MLIFNRFYGTLYKDCLILNFNKIGVNLMGNKKSSGTKYKSEEDVYEDLQRLMQVWNKNGTRRKLFSKRSYLSSVKMEFRSSRICEIVFSNPNVFKFEEEIKYIPMELMSEEFLIQIVYDEPQLLCSKYEQGKQTVTIPKEKLTLPVLVAFELGKRRYEKFSAMKFGKDGKKIPYTEKILEYRKTITDTADKVEEKIGTNNLKHTQAFKEADERDAFINELVTSIQEESTSVELRPDEHYKPKYTHSNYNSDKKLLILVSGYADSGKTTFSHYLASTIDGAICFDSDQLLERGLLDLKLSKLLRTEDNVVIFSDLDAFDFFRPQEINDAMGNANILKVYIKPSSIKRMLHHSKYRQRS